MQIANFSHYQFSHKNPLVNSLGIAIDKNKFGCDKSEKLVKNKHNKYI